MKNKVILAYSSVDGTGLADEIKNLLSDKPLEISEALNEEIDIWDSFVILYILTPAGLADPDLINFAQKAHSKDFPLVAVVSDLEERLFEYLPEEIKFLAESNIISLRPGDHTPSVVQT